MAEPLIQEKGVASIILETPFYGLRKPKEQFRSRLRHVSDLFTMGASLILESLVLFHWCEKEGFSPIVAHGISMGGQMASLGATVWPKPMGLVPCLSWTSGTLSYTKGVLSGAIPWDLLEKQYMKDNAYKEEVLKLIEGEESAFKAGTNFAKEMDRCAQVNEIKNSEIFRKIGEDPLGGANNRILKGTSSSSTETKYKESCAMTKQLTKEDVARVDKNTVPN